MLTYDIWDYPLSDYNRVVSSNQFAAPRSHISDVDSIRLVGGRAQKCRPEDYCRAMGREGGEGGGTLKLNLQRSFVFQRIEKERVED